jgi:hypothetical protein
MDSGAEEDHAEEAEQETVLAAVPAKGRAEVEEEDLAVNNLFKLIL